MFSRLLHEIVRNDSDESITISNSRGIVSKPRVSAQFWLVEDLVDELSKLGTIGQVMLKFDDMAQKNTPGGHFQHLS